MAPSLVPPPDGASAEQVMEYNRMLIEYYRISLAFDNNRTALESKRMDKIGMAIQSNQAIARSNEAIVVLCVLT